MSGPIKNQRHERFAKGLFDGKVAYQAYLDAGYTCSSDDARGLASKLSAKAHIAERVAELAGRAEERLIKKVVLTKEWVVDQMIDAADSAKDDKGHSARIRALELLGRETGAFTEQKRVAIRSFDEMTADEIEAFLAGQPVAADPKKTDRSRKG